MAKTRWAALAAAAMAAVAVAASADAQTPDAGSAAARAVAFNKSYGPGWFDAVIVLPDGGFALAGREFDMVGPGQARTRGALVVRLDRNGVVVWRKSFGSPAAPRYAMSITALPGGHFDVAGTAHVGPRTLEWWAELDADGRLIKEVMTDGGGRSRSKLREIVRQIVRLSDGRHAVIDDNSLESGSTKDWQLVVVNRDGSDALHLKLPDKSADCNGVLAGERDGGFVLAWQDVKDGKNSGPRVRRYDAHGDIVYERAFGTHPNACPNDIHVLDDDGYVLTGGLADATEKPAWAARLDAQGSLLWEQRYGVAGGQVAMSYAVTGAANGPVVASGCVQDGKTSQDPDFQAFVSVFDAQGRQVWSKIVHAGQNGSMVRALALLPDGGLVLVGSRNSGCLEISGHLSGGEALVFTIPPDQMPPGSTAAGGARK